ncbi:DUF1766-domain-containing protein [Lepidopterella palustris CBS 459.81]|uniref:DUF1766-domain-containing protein n=1 Tax=Lepidopterella palustris CBS 459.81 TaxID=1314670 RepID=A0A8E2J9K9_9PEZI|nr:DUF1766-domain-containing protein [Lepidopterella palustris CBS 459.81]
MTNYEKMSNTLAGPTERSGGRRTPPSDTTRPTVHSTPARDEKDSELSSSNEKSAISSYTDQTPKTSSYSTPITPPSDDGSYLRSRNATPQSPCPKRASGKSPLEALAIQASQLEGEGTTIRTKSESNDDKPRWLFKGLVDDISQNSPYSLRPRRRESWVRPDETATRKQSERPFTQIDFDFSKAWEKAQRSGSSAEGNGAGRAAAETSKQPFPKPIKEERDGIEPSISNSNSSRSVPKHEAERVHVVTKGEVSLTSQTENLIRDGKSVSVQNSRVSIDISAKTSVSSKVLPQILPFNTRERVVASPGVCAASLTRKPNQQCSKRAKGPVRETTKLLERLSESDLYAGETRILKQLLGSALCTDHIKVALQKLGEIQKLLGQPPGGQKNGLSVKDPLIADSTILAVWIKSLTSARPPQDNLPGETSQEGTSSGTRTRLMVKNQTPPIHVTGVITEISKFSSLSPASATITQMRSSRITRKSQLERPQLDGYVQDLQPYRPKYTAIFSTPELISRALTRPLTARELETGYIYMYWFPPNFGGIKIGVTHRDVKKRLEEWRSQCNHRAESLIEEDLQEQFKVQHVFRLEALVQAELRDFRKKEIKCRGCGKSHNEWFDVHVEDAKKVVKKYLDWMKKGPYELISSAGKSEWRLKESISNTEIDELCRPLELEHSSKNNINVNERRRVSSAGGKNVRARVSRKGYGVIVQMGANAERLLI